MVVDTSALIAILQGEPERRSLLEALEGADTRRISVATLLEVSMVLEARHGQLGLQDLDLFLARAEFEFIAVDRDQAQIARRAFSRFGKGRHPAGLNFGDCFSYALAMFLGESLLRKGGDFLQTDVRIASNFSQQK